LGGHFKKLLDWKFDKVRVAKDRTFRNNKQHEQIINNHLFDYELFGVKSETLELVIPPPSPPVVRNLYDVLTQHVVLVAGTNGVGFRETRANLIDILKEHNIDYLVVKPFIDNLEYRLISQYNEDTKDK
jgi:hypothetical protein